MRQLELIDTGAGPPEGFYRRGIRKLYEQLRECGYNASDEDIESAWLMYSEEHGWDWAGIHDDTQRNVPLIMQYFTVIENESMAVGI